MKLETQIKKFLKDYRFDAFEWDGKELTCYLYKQSNGQSYYERWGRQEFPSKTKPYKEFCRMENKLFKTIGDIYFLNNGFQNLWCDEGPNETKFN